MAAIVSVLNRLLPFATPGTPILLDLVHLAALCTLLYFAPQIQQRLQQGRLPHSDNGQGARVVDTGVQRYNAETAHRENGLDAPNGSNHQVANQVLGEHEQEPNDGPLPEPEDLDQAEEAQHARNLETTRQRNIGAKKAKSLARKDQRRAYYEFMRSQGDAQRAQDAREAGERKATVAAERERRKASERQLEARKASEREAKRLRENAQREEHSRRVNFVLSTVRQELDERPTCDLFKLAKMTGDDVDEEWVEKILQASGMLGRKNDVLTMITTMGCVVTVSAEDMAALYQRVIDNDLGDTDGLVSYDKLATLLQQQLEKS